MHSVLSVSVHRLITAKSLVMIEEKSNEGFYSNLGKKDCISSKRHYQDLFVEHYNTAGLTHHLERRSLLELVRNLTRVIF